MSAYIVKDETINKILNYIYWCHDDRIKYSLKKHLKKCGFDYEKLKNLNTDKEINKYLKEFGQKLLNLNYKSVNACYNRKDKTHIFQFKNIDGINKIQFLKSLGCFLYQSCEGEQDKTKLYLSLRDLENSICMAIVYESDEFKKAIWG